MLNSIKKALVVPAVIVLAVFLQGCKTDPLSKIPIDEKLLTEYHKVSGTSATSSAGGEVDVYLDYSNGMREKILSDSSFFLSLMSTLNPTGQGSTGVNFYRVGAVDTPRLIDKSVLETDFRNPDNYKEKASKLLVAIRAINQNKNRAAVFITDFERIDKFNSSVSLPTEESKLPWAKEMFAEWLSVGNQIDVITSLDNRVFVLVFTPRSLINDPVLFKNSRVSEIMRRMSDRKKFSYSVSNFIITQNGKATESGNANENLIVQENIVSTKPLGFEYYVFKSTDLLNFNADESQKGDKRIINRVTIKANNEALSGEQYDIHVTDVSEGIIDLFNSQTQSEGPAPEPDAETGKVDSTSMTNTKFEYKPGAEVTDVFEVVYNPKTEELGIKVKPDFTGVQQSTLYRVDVVLKDVSLKEGYTDTSALKLTYGAESIYPLSNSLQEALDGARRQAEGKPIYTFYIKIIK